MIEPRPKRSASLVILLAGGVVTGIVFASPFLAYQRQRSLAMATFRERANDVQPVITAVYRHYFETGDWPESVEALNDPGLGPLLEDWEYVRWSENEPPLLRTQGSLHTKLEYWFRDRGDLAAPGGWRCRCEGDAVKFEGEEKIPLRPE